MRPSVTATGTSQVPIWTPRGTMIFQGLCEQREEQGPMKIDLLLQRGSGGELGLVHWI